MGTTTRPTPGTSLAVVESAPRQALTFQDFVKGLSSGANSLNSAKQLATLYDKAVESLLGDGDVQTDKKTKRKFKKKSAWLKLGRYFHIDTVLVSVTKEWTPDGHFLCVVTKRAIAQWGQVAEAIGACSTAEERGKRKITVADAIGTADTRANNRAISNLIAQGEVSAEEVQRGAERHDDDAEDEEDGIVVEDDDTVTMTLDAAKAMPWPWRTPAKYQGKPFSEVSDDVLARVELWYETHEDTPNAATLLVASRMVLADRAAAKATPLTPTNGGGSSPTTNGGSPKPTATSAPTATAQATRADADAREPGLEPEQIDDDPFASA